jgi:hypothetical protein
MKEEETAVLRKLVEAHDLFKKLPTQHPNDIDEWVDKLHDLQRMVMQRAAVRMHPELFLNVNP